MFYWLAAGVLSAAAAWAPRVVVDVHSRAARATAEDVAQACRSWEYVMFFDGGSRGNPGVGGCGAVVQRVEKDGSRSSAWEAWAYLCDDSTTNNQAEYAGLLLGIKGLGDIGATRCLICGDSKLVVNQLAGAWKCKDTKLAALRERAVRGLAGIEFQVMHVGREFNGKADELANRAMDTQLSGSTRDDPRRAALRRECEAAHAALDAIQTQIDAERRRIDAAYRAALKD